MKTDYSFKLVTVIVLAGVLVAFLSPTHPPSASEPVAQAATLAPGHSE